MRYLSLLFVFFLLTSCGEKAPEQAESSAQTESTMQSESAIDSGSVESSKDSVEAESTTTLVEGTEAKSEPVEAQSTAPVKPAEPVVQNKAVLWRSYRQVKGDIKKAEAADNYQKQVKLLLQAADLANQLERQDIEAWQYNNVGYALIKDFKAKANYYDNMNELDNLVYKSEIEASREKIKAVFSQHLDLLKRAKLYLLRAERIDNDLEKSSRSHTIASNLLFVNQVMNFMGEQK